MAVDNFILYQIVVVIELVSESSTQKVAWNFCTSDLAVN